jgi:hypothetical protein
MTMINYLTDPDHIRDDTGDDSSIEPFVAEVLDANALTPPTPSIAQFCDLVDACLRANRDPRATVERCEQQAETLRVTPEDATPENLQLLIDTLLNTIDQLDRDAPATHARPIQPAQPARTIRTPRPTFRISAVWRMGKAWLHRGNFGHQPVAT